MLGAEEEELALRISDAINEGIAGNCDRAVEMLEQLLAEMEADGPREDLGALHVRHQLVVMYGWAERFESAVELAERNLKGFSALLGPEDQETFQAQPNTTSSNSPLRSAMSPGRSLSSATTRTSSVISATSANPLRYVW
jgi:hypothetical protein